MATRLPDKDNANIEPYFVVWCDKEGINNGTDDDDGELQGATISTSAWTVTPVGLTIVSNNTAAVTIHGVVYPVNTVATVWVSGGTDGEQYTLTNQITTSDAKTLNRSILIRIREQ